MSSLNKNWPKIRQVFADALKTSYHFSLATTDGQGNPHITPIGSLYLYTEPRGYYIDIFSKKMNKNLETQDRVCVMAVPSRMSTWLRALWTGRFSKPPGMRLYGKISPRRPATEKEVAYWRKAFGRFSWLKGYDLLWKDLEYVREIVFDDWSPINLGTTTRGLWKK